MMQNTLDVAISSGGSLSGAAQLNEDALIGIVTPTAWTPGNLTFQVSEDGSTYNNLYDVDGNEVTVTAAASQYIGMVPADYVGFNYVKVRSGTSGTPVAQGGPRTVSLVVREV